MGFPLPAPAPPSSWWCGLGPESGSRWRGQDSRGAGPFPGCQERAGGRAQWGRAGGVQQGPGPSPPVGWLSRGPAPTLGMRSPGHRLGGRGGDGHRVCSLRVRGRGVLSCRTGSEAGPHPPTMGAWAPARGCSRVKNGVPSRRPEPLGLGKAVSLHRAGTGDTLPLKSLPGPPSQGQEEQGTAPLHLHLRRGRGVREPSPGHLAGTGPPGLALGAREGATGSSGAPHSPQPAIVQSAR